MYVRTYIHTHAHIRTYIRTYIHTHAHTYIRTVHAKLKFPLVFVELSLRNVIMEGTLEPCHLPLVLSTSLIALALAAVSITKQKTILLDLLITLGEGDKALKCLP